MLFYTMSHISRLDSFYNLLEIATNFIKNIVENDKQVLIISHYDADGLSSAAILLDLLLSEKILFHLKIAEQVDNNLLTFLKENEYQYIILLDMGSRSLNFLCNIGKEILILDHHEPLISNKMREKVNVLNPHIVGINGSFEISTSGIVYFLAKNFLRKNYEKYIIPAIVGALGDRQDIGPQFRLVGLNEKIIEEGVRKGIIETKIGLRLYGLNRNPLVKALAYTMDPYIPGLSGNENACFMFFKRIGINPIKNSKLRYFSSLSNQEVKKLATELIKYAISKGVSVKNAEKLFGVNYYILSEDKNTMFHDARDYSIVLNACGRMERYDLAILIFNEKWKKKIINDILNVVKEYRKHLAQFLEKIYSESSKFTRESKYFTIIMSHEINSKMCGAIASMLTTFFTKKPFIMVMTSLNNGNIKISIRKTQRKFERNINLGKIIGKISEKIGGYGGGHSNAGGAIIPKNSIENFIKKIDEEIEKTMRNIGDLNKENS